MIALVDYVKVTTTKSSTGKSLPKETGGLQPVAETWRRVWGDGNFFRGPRFLNNDGFFGKFSILTA